MAAVLPDATKLAESLLRDYGVQNTAILLGILWVMAKTRTDFLLFKRDIEKRVENIEKNEVKRDGTLTEHWDIINSHGRKLAAQESTLKAHDDIVKTRL